MKSLESRLSKIEAIKAHKERPTAWIAIISVNGSVEASHQDHGKFSFTNVNEFDAFRKARGILEGDFIGVEIVNEKQT